MNGSHRMVRTGIATVITGTLLTFTPLDTDAARPTPTWFKPPWPCVVVRANLPGPPKYGFCPSPKRLAQWLPASQGAGADDPIVSDTDGQRGRIRGEETA
jgi:hypothetical protein